MKTLKTLINLTGDFYLPATPLLDDIQEVLQPAAPLDLADEAAVAAALSDYAHMPNLIILLPDETAVTIVQRALPRAEIVILEP